MTCRILCEFGMSAIHHPTEAVRKAAERILVHVYKVNPRFVRKQLPPDDEVTRRNIMYRQLMQEFERIDQEVSTNMYSGTIIYNICGLINHNYIVGKRFRIFR